MAYNPNVANAIDEAIQLSVLYRNKAQKARLRGEHENNIRKLMYAAKEWENEAKRLDALLHQNNNALGNNPLGAINTSVLTKRGRFTRANNLPRNNGLGNNPLGAVNSSVLVRRGRFSRKNRKSRRRN